MRVTYGWESADEPDLLARAESLDGQTITVVRAPAAAIDGEDGPVVISGSSAGRVVVVVSAESLSSFSPAATDSTERLVEKAQSVGSIIGDAIAIGILAARESGT